MKHQCRLAPFAAAALVAVSSTTYAQEASAPEKARVSSWCERTERVLFSCRSQQQTISLCLADAATAPRLNFVFGIKGRPPLAQVPTKGRLTWYGTFTYEQQHTGNGGWLRLSASAAELEYVLFQNWHAQGMPAQSAGVGVIRDRHQQELHLCDAESFTDPDLYHLDKWPGTAVPMDPLRVGASLRLPTLSWTRCDGLGGEDKVAQCRATSTRGPGG